MLSRSEAGSRREIDWVDGFKFGKPAGLALDQSTYWVESRPSQKRRSSASVLNLGMGLRFFFIDHSFFTMHTSCGNNAYLHPLCSPRESNVQQPPRVLSQHMKSEFTLAVLNVFQHKQWRTEEHLFSLTLAHAVSFLAPLVAIIPIEPFNLINERPRGYVVLSNTIEELARRRFFHATKQSMTNADSSRGEFLGYNELVTRNSIQGGAK